MILLVNTFHLYSQVLQSGCQYWGADCHFDRSGPYLSIPISDQIADLKNIFGNTPNTILYRGELGSDPASVTNQLEAGGIIPIALIIGYPDWGNWNTNDTSDSVQEAEAYTWAYNTVAPIVQANPKQMLWEIGNEWDLQSPIAEQIVGIGNIDDQLYQNIANLPAFPEYRGAYAGAVAAIRDNNPDAQIIGGGSAGWNKNAFPAAFAQGTLSYAPQGGRNLCFDFATIHWYVDGRPGGNSMGMPDNINWLNGENAYKINNQSERPWLCTEFGSSDSMKAAYDNQCVTNMTNLLDNFLAHKDSDATEQGFAGGTYYELYSYGAPSATELGYRLYDYNGGSSNAGISAVGTAVKNWMTLHPSCGATPIDYINEDNRNIVSIYPNPSNKNFSLKFSSEIMLKNAVMKIYDLFGKEVKNVLINTYETNFDRGKLQNGIYFYRIINDDEEIAEGKLIIL